MRSRFVSDRMLKTMQQIGYQSAALTDAVAVGGEGDAALDVAARLKEMW